uniref:VRR-NUC domain-containing protein n=1 Tax=viral metagenome TaxID=1070528 RepID=A0A6M3LQD4_9ZZZZ
MKESEVLRACEDYLQYQRNQCKLWFTRLNSGDIFMEGRRFKGAGKGTADLMVVQSFKIPARIETLELNVLATNVIFIECKSSTGKQSPDQRAFQEEVEALGCGYFLVRDLNELEEIIY